MDELDYRLIKELQPDPRKSCAKLANSLGMTERTVSKRIDRLVSSGEIIFTVLPDMRYFGYPTSAYIGLRLERASNSSAIAEYLCKSPNLRFVSTCQGFADLFMRGEFTSNTDLAYFITDHLAKIKGVSRIDTMVELEKIKQLSWGLRNQNMGSVKKQHTVAIDEADKRLISELQKNSRVPLKGLGEQLDMSKPTVHRRMKNLVTSGAIELTVIPNYDKIGYTTHGFALIVAELPKLINVAKSIASYTQISTVGIYSGPVQILAGIHLSSPEVFIDLITKELPMIEGIVRLETLLHLKVFKQRFFWLQQQLPVLPHKESHFVGNSIHT